MTPEERPTRQMGLGEFLSFMNQPVEDECIDADLIWFVHNGSYSVWLRGIFKTK